MEVENHKSLHALIRFEDIFSVAESENEIMK